MDPNKTDDKNMALDDLIKRDMAKKKAAIKGAKGAKLGAGGGGIRGKMQRTAGAKLQAQRGGSKFGRGFQAQRGSTAGGFSGQRGGGRGMGGPLGKPRRTGNMIAKNRENPEQGPRKFAGSNKAMMMKNANRPGSSMQNRPPYPRNDPQRAARDAQGGYRSSKMNAPAGGPRRDPVSARGPIRQQERGGLAHDKRRKQILAQPKQAKTLRVGPEKKQAVQKKIKALQPSDRRLKVRNILEDQVTNSDLTKLFVKHGQLEICRFDRNDFGQFLGSATVQYKRPEDAKRAKEDYHGATLDDRILIVEYDLVKTTISGNQQQSKEAKKEPVVRKDPSGGSAKGKTLKLQQKP